MSDTYYCTHTNGQGREDRQGRTRRENGEGTCRTLPRNDCAANHKEAPHLSDVSGPAGLIRFVAEFGRLPPNARRLPRRFKALRDAVAVGQARACPAI